MKVVISLTCALWFLAGMVSPASAVARERYAVDAKLELVSVQTRQPFEVPGGRGYTYEILSRADGKVYVRLFDGRGFELQGDYELDATQIPEVAAGDSLEKGLRAATGRAPARPVVPGCCDVAEGSEQPAQPTRTTLPVPRPSGRAPAIAPGTQIVEAEPLPTSPEKIRKPAGSPPRSSAELCQVYKKFRAGGVPDAPLRQAMRFLERAREEGIVDEGGESPGSRYVAIADYSQNSRKKRFYLLDLKNGAVTSDKVSHGRGKNNAGDPDHDGMLDRCGTGMGSERTAPGFTQVGEYYFSTRGRFSGWPMLTKKPARNAMKLYSLDEGRKGRDLVFGRGLVMHEATYNQPGDDKKMGRSEGCQAFLPGEGRKHMSKLSRGGLLYTYAPQCRAEMRPVLKQASGWEKFCK